MTAGGPRRQIGPWRALAPALLAAVAALAVPAGAGAQSVYGVSILKEPPPADYARMGAAGADVVRVVLSWPHAQPRRGEAFEWRAFDSIVDAAARGGVEVLPILYGTPSWAVRCAGLAARKCRRVPPLRSPEARSAWERFVRAAVERYGRQGSFWTSRIPPLSGTGAGGLPALERPPYTPVTRWQVWNEPSSPTYWKGSRPDPRAYAELVEISAGAIRARDPGASILLAGLYGSPAAGRPGLRAWRYLGRLYGVPGIERHFDAVALHPYVPSLRGVARQLRRVRGTMRRRGDAATPVWITEIGWGSADRDEGPLLKGLDGQARILERAFARLAARRPWRVEGVVWFDWRDPGELVDGCTSPFCLSAGLLAEDGEEKPSFSSFAEIASAG